MHDLFILRYTRGLCGDLWKLFDEVRMVNLHLLLSLYKEERCIDRLPHF